MPTPYETVYGATKAFVRSLSQSLRDELKETGVAVTALMPGATETEFFHRAGADDPKMGASEKDDPAEVAKEDLRPLSRARITSSLVRSRTNCKQRLDTHCRILWWHPRMPACWNPVQNTRSNSRIRLETLDGSIAD